MNNPPGPARPVARVTCLAHRQFGEEIAARMRAMGLQSVLVENARCVRQRIRGRPFRLPGRVVRWDDSPMDLFRMTVSRGAAPAVMRELTEVAGLDRPGRGSMFIQDILEFSRVPVPGPPAGGEAAPTSGELALVTAILSIPGGGDRIARIALKLGACVPAIHYGDGTGVRDRLGLIRVALPPEREIVQLVVPRQDAFGLLRILIEEGGVDRPGGGFLYQTPIRAGRLDSLIRIGRQEHAASMEQVIAALDALQKGTAWRRRFLEPDPATAGSGPRLLRGYREIVFHGSEGRTDGLVRAAVRAGAGGVTLSRVHCLCGRDVEGGVAARERGALCVPAANRDTVLEALFQAAGREADPVFRVQETEAPLVFSRPNRPA